jgi:hypothetical protein
LREEVGAEPFRRKYLKENPKEKKMKEEEEGNVPELPDVVQRSSAQHILSTSRRRNAERCVRLGPSRLDMTCRPSYVSMTRLSTQNKRKPRNLYLSLMSI